MRKENSLTLCNSVSLRFFLVILLLCQISVGTFYDINTGIRVPRLVRFLVYSRPLGLSAFEFDYLKRRALVKSVSSDIFDAFGYFNGIELFASAKRAVAYARHRFRKNDVRQRLAIFEREFADARYAVGQSDAFKLTTVLKCVTAYARNALRNTYAFERQTLIESIFAYRLDRARNIYGSQLFAARKRVASYFGERAVYGNGRQAGAAVERAFPNARDICMNAYLGDILVAVKRVILYRSNGLTVVPRRKLYHGVGCFAYARDDIRIAAGRKLELEFCRKRRKIARRAN